MGRLIDILAAIISIGAGVYLLSQTGGTINVGGEQGTS